MTKGRSTNLTTYVPKRKNLMVIGKNKIEKSITKEQITNSIVKAPDHEHITSARKFLSDISNTHFKVENSRNEAMRQPNEWKLPVIMCTSLTPVNHPHKDDSKNEKLK